MHQNNSTRYNFKEPYKHAVEKRYGNETVGCSADSSNEETRGCFCCDSDEDSLDGIRIQQAKQKCIQKCFRICLLSCLIIGYTFVGSVIFLTTEDAPPYGAIAQQIISMAFADKMDSSEKAILSYPNESTFRVFSQLGAENREKTVQNIWEITVNLNILYRDNWTRLAAKELNLFQDRLLELLWQEKLFVDPPVFSQDTQRIADNSPTHWKLGKAFLYSISILATIGYGNSLSRSSTSKLISMIYAALGLPVMFMYLSSMGSLLSSCARHVFSRTLCCCLCSKCGYCCYDEKLMEEKERRMRRKRELKEYKQQMTAALASQHSEPFYVGSTNLNNIEMGNLESIQKTKTSVGSDNRIPDYKLNNEYSRFLAPLFVCIMFTFLYIIIGSLVLYNLDENWTFLDSIYFCFMLISTIGLGDTVPLNSALSPYAQYSDINSAFLVWFFSLYIFIGLGFSAMCFNIIHDGVRRKITNLHFYSGNKLRRKSSKKSMESDIASRGSVDTS